MGPKKIKHKISSIAHKGTPLLALDIFFLLFFDGVEYGFLWLNIYVDTAVFTVVFTMGKEDTKKGPLKRLLNSIPGRREKAEVQTFSFSSKERLEKRDVYEFEATVGSKGNSLGITFDRVSSVLARLHKGMKARVIMERTPGGPLFTARIHFIEPEEEKEPVSRARS